MSATTDLVQRLRGSATRTTNEAADTIEALQAERDALVKTLAASCEDERAQLWEAGQGGGCARAIDAEAERDALRADAERYRWLCNGHGYFMEEEMLCGHSNNKKLADAAIDAARKEQP